MKTLKHICPRSVGSLVADLGLNFRTVKNQTNKNSAYDYSVIFLPTACAGGCRLRCLTANFCEWSRLGRHCGSLESHCPTLLAVAMKGLCAHWDHSFQGKTEIWILWNHLIGDFPGGPVAKTLSSHCRGPGSIPGQGTRSHMLQLRPGAAKWIKK